MKKNIIIFVIIGIILSGCVLLQAIGAFSGTEEVVQPPNFQRVFIAILISAGLYWGGFLWLKSYVEKRSKKYNIAQLKLLSRKLFDSFNNFLKEGGLLEDLWKEIARDRNEGDEVKFRKMLADARNLVQQENMEQTLKIFESVAEEILAGKERISMQELTKCEEVGFSRITNLLGSEFAKSGTRYLQSIFIYWTNPYEWECLVSGDLLKKIKDNEVDIEPFELQLTANREILSSQNNLSRSPGILGSIIEIMKFILW